MQIEPGGKGQLSVQWRDGSVPQAIRYDATKPSARDEFPVLPETFADNPPALLPALHAAGATTDLSTAAVCSRAHSAPRQVGKSRRHRRRQMLVHDGFEFPWEKDLLIPASKVFGTAELQGQSVAIGKTDDWVAVRVGSLDVLLPD